MCPSCHPEFWFYFFFHFQVQLEILEIRILLVKKVQLPGLWFSESMVVSSLNIRATALFFSSVLLISGCWDGRLSLSAHFYKYFLMFQVVTHPKLKSWTGLKQLGPPSPPWASGSLNAMCSILVRWYLQRGEKKGTQELSSLSPYCAGPSPVLFSTTFTLEHFIKLQLRYFTAAFHKFTPLSLFFHLLELSTQMTSQGCHSYTFLVLPWAEHSLFGKTLMIFVFSLTQTALHIRLKSMESHPYFLWVLRNLLLKDVVGTDWAH